MPERESKKTEPLWQRFNDRITQALLCLFTFGLSFVGYWQWSALESTNQAATAARQSAIAAIQAAEAGREQMRLDQRAWLGVDFIRPEPLIPQIGKAFVVSIGVKNTGKTPARKVVSHGKGELMPKGVEPNFAYYGIEKFDAGMLPPGATTTITVMPMTRPTSNQPIIVNDGTLKALIDQSSRIYVHGQFDYEDIFGIAHWITYCADLIIPFNGSFGFCPNHNDTDYYQTKK